MSRLLDWLLGRGVNPLAGDEVAATSDDHVPGSPASIDSTLPTHPHEYPEGAEPHVPDEEESDSVLEQWARELGVDVLVMRTLVEQRRALVYDVAADPRAWGFDLLPASAPRRDVAAEFRRQTRMTGELGDSFLQGHDPLLALVPEPPTMPDGTPLDAHLQAHARIDAEPARDIAHHVRTTIQATLGRPLDREAFEHAVRETAWDHDLDASHVAPLVVRAVDELL